jgi:GT2 family glycosyltransferase
MNKKVAIILINYKDYAKKYLDDCLESIRVQDFQGESVLYIVDNETSEETFGYLKEKAPEAKIIRNEKNDGFAKGNNDAIKIAFRDACDYVFLLNMDTIMDDRALSEVVKTMESDEKIGAVQSRLMLHPEVDKINSLGNNTHFLGFGFCDSYNEVYRKDDVLDGAKIFYPSGAAVLFRRSVLEKIGLFDEDYFMYSEDQDLGWRVWLADNLCVLSKDSVVYHKYEFARSISKYYYMDRNRIITALKNYKATTLIILAPAFIVMEIGLFYFSIRNRWYKEKIKICLEFFTLGFWKKVKEGRSNVAKIRKIKDKDLMCMISGKISYQEISSPLLSIANIFLNLYFIFTKFLLRLFNI